MVSGTIHAVILLTALFQVYSIICVGGLLFYVRFCNQKKNGGLNYAGYLIKKSLK